MGKIVGTTHRLPKAKNPKGLQRYGHQGSASGRLGNTYHNQHYMRTGKYGKEGNAAQWSHTQKKVGRSLGASLALGGMAAGAAHAGAHPNVVAGLSGASIGASLYSSAQSGRAAGQMNKDTGTRPSLLGGFHQHPNNRNAATGIRSSNPSQQRSMNRVGSKGY